jgi:hypothetical protein
MHQRFDRRLGASMACEGIVTDDAGRWDQADLSILDSYLRETYPDAYAGLRRSDDGSVYILRTAVTALDADVLSHARFPVKFFNAQHTRLQLEQVAARIVADRGYWQSKGVRIALVVVPHDGTKVEIATPQAATARGSLLEWYDEALVTVTLDDVVPL